VVCLAQWRDSTSRGGSYDRMSSVAATALNLNDHLAGATAGSETTQSLIAGILYAMTQYPDQGAALLADPELATGAVEETLRWWTPVNSMARQATTDVELRGKTIHAGENVLLAYGSANRDEEEWGDDADEWDILRPSAKSHLAFGFAEHFCLGASLARREARIVLSELLTRFPNYELTGDTTRVRQHMTPGIKTMPVVFRR